MVKKESEQEQIDKDYTQIVMQNSKKEAEELENKKINEALIASMAERLKSIPESARTVMAWGYSYDDAMEAFDIVGDNAELMMSYLFDRK